MAQYESFDHSFLRGYEDAFKPSTVFGGSEISYQRGFSMGEQDRIEGKNDPKAALQRYWIHGENPFRDKVP